MTCCDVCISLLVCMNLYEIWACYLCDIECYFCGSILSLIWFKFNFLLFQNHYHTPKQRKIKFKQRIKLKNNTDTKCGFPLYLHTYIHILYLNTIWFKAPSLWTFVRISRRKIYDTFLIVKNTLDMTVLVTHFSADKFCVIVRFVQRDLHFQPALSPTVYF